jgi:hypothetical protein
MRPDRFKTYFTRKACWEFEKIFFFSKRYRNKGFGMQQHVFTYITTIALAAGTKNTRKTPPNASERRLGEVSNVTRAEQHPTT